MFIDVDVERACGCGLKTRLLDVKKRILTSRVRLPREMNFSAVPYIVTLDVESK